MKRGLITLMFCIKGLFLFAQLSEKSTAVYFSPFHLAVNALQVNFETPINERNSVVLGVNFQGKNTFAETDNDEVQVNFSSMVGVMFDLNHKLYTPIVRDRSVNAEKTYLSLFILHGPSYRYQEHTYEIEVFRPDENFEFRFREGKTYEYITNLGYTLGVGFQFVPYRSRFILEAYIGGKAQYSWITESEYLNENYREEFYDYGYRGVIPQLFLRLGFFLGKME